MERREFLKAGVGLSASGVTAALARPLRASAASTAEATRWRAFEMTTRAEIIGPVGATRAWLPLPLMPDTDYQKNLGQTWMGNAAGARVLREDKYGAGILYAEWAAGEPAPVIEVTARGGFVGTPQRVAAEIDRHVQDDACDGFIFIPHLTPHGLDDFVDRVVPLLQERGVLRREYEHPTLRANLGLADSGAH